MLSLSITHIKDYQTCARMYDYRHGGELAPIIANEDLMQIKFHNTLKKVVAFFFYKRQGDYTPSYSALLNRWERLWFPKDMTAYDIIADQHSIVKGNMASYTTAAAAALLNFHEVFSADQGQPFIVDEQFVFPLNKQIKFEDSIDLVLRYPKDNTFVLFKWYLGKTKPIMSRYNLDFALYKMVLEQKLGAALQTHRCVYGLYDLTASKPSFIRTRVAEEDTNSLKYWANEILTDEVKPSRRGFISYCKTCEYDEICAEWTGWPSNEARVLVNQKAN